jgi:hypothetical protein
MPQARAQDGATMRETRAYTKQAHFFIDDDGHAELSKMARIQDTSVSDLLRRYVHEGMWRDKFLARGGEIIYRKDGKERRHSRPPF